jgi:nucleotide-binding universal stress UspA family protein
VTEQWFVGIDGSDAATDALRWAVKHAAERGVDLTAIGAFHVPTVLALFVAKRGFGVDELGLAASAGHDVDVAIESVVRDPDDGFRVQSSVIEGLAPHVLVDASTDAQLLVLGRTGSGELRHHRLGSVARYCVTHSHAPVAVIPAGTGADAISSIVVGFDGSEHSGAALRWALHFAGGDAQVRVIAAIDVAPWVDDEISRERYGDRIEVEEQRIVMALDAVDPDGHAERSIIVQGVRQALAEAEPAADLLVVGTRGHGRITAGLLGSVSSWLLHDSTVPVVVVPSR